MGYWATKRMVGTSSTVLQEPIEGIHYTDGETDEGPTREVVLDRRLAWSVKHDNRLAQNREYISTKKMSFEETYNEIRTFSQWI